MGDSDKKKSAGAQNLTKGDEHRPTNIISSVQCVSVRVNGTVKILVS